MKRIIALLTLFVLVLTFAACGKGDVNGGFGGAPEDEAEAIPTVSFEDFTTLSFTSTVTVDDQVTEAYNAFYRTDSIGAYYEKSVTDGYGFETYFVDTTEGVSAYTRFSDSSQFTLTDGVMEDMTDSEYRDYMFACYGFAPEKAYDDLTAEKGEDVTVGDFECTSYEVSYTDPFGDKIESTVCVDKETGLWVKESFTVDGMEICSTVTKIDTDISDMPGTVPVSVTPGQIYSQDGLTLNLKGIEFDPTYAAILKMEAVNATDSALNVKSKFFDVNGLCIGGSVFSVSVPAGESLDFDINIPDKACDIAGVDMIEEMEFSVSAEKYHVEASGEGSYEVSDGMLIEYSVPVKITAECPIEPEAEESGERRMLCKADDFAAYFGGIRENSSGGYDFVVYYESEFNEDIRLTVNIHEVNGKAYDDFEKVYLYSMRKGFGGFTLWSDKVTEEPTSLKLSFEAYYGELYNGTCILEETEPFVLTLK